MNNLSRLISIIYHREILRLSKITEELLQINKNLVEENINLEKINKQLEDEIKLIKRLHKLD